MKTREYSEFLVNSLKQTVLTNRCPQLSERGQELFLKGYMDSFLVSLVMDVPELERIILDRIEYVVESK